jgi:uncharacterized protein
MALTGRRLAFASASRRRWGLLALAAALALIAMRPVALKAQEQRGFAQSGASDGVAVNGNYYALVIGIDKYPAPLHQLKTAVNDAQSVGRLLHDRYGFQVQYLLDQNATRYNILNALGKLRAALHENDNLLIYYGGHGYFDHETDRTYWLPVDADSGTSPNTIMADDLTSLIRALPSRHVLIVSDSCYSGGLSRDADGPARTGSDPGLLNRELRSRSRTLMASGGNEPVSDSGANGHSVFANAILNALERTDEPMFTAIDLFYTSVRRQVAGKSAQLPEYSTIRNSNDEDGDFVFVRETISGPARAPDPLTPDRANGLVAAGDYASALPLFTSACERGEAIGCSGLGVLYRNGFGVTKDDTRAVGLFRKACDGGRMPACSNLGALYDQGEGVAKDAAQAYNFYRKACNGGDAPGCTDLGQVYEEGDGVARDDSMATSLYREGCDGGNALGCADLGYMYEEGKGVGKDVTQAVNLYRKACDGGDARGCSNLGGMYQDGIGVDKDEIQAVSLFRKACDGGSMDGCTNLGVMYEKGTGVTNDDVQAVSLYRKACDADNEHGCADLGYMYETGRGVVADKSQAAILYRKGCDGGDSGGCRSLKRLQPDTK